MKRPDELIIMEHVETKSSLWKDHNGKPSVDCYIRLPYWVIRAYHLRLGDRVLLTIPARNQSFAELSKRCTNYMPYVKANWDKKLAKLRKINHNYMTVTIVHAEGEGLEKK